MDLFLGKVQEIITNNDELKNSIILTSVLENVKYTGDNLSYLTSLKEGISDVNSYLKNNDLSSIIVSIDEKIEELNKTDINGFVKRTSNEFDIISLAESIKSSGEVNDPKLTGYLTSLINECKTGKHPSYLYLNSLINTLSNFTEYTSVKESIDKCSTYINENNEKLIVLDTINYIESMGTHGLNPKVSKVLKESLFESEYNPDIIELRLGDSAKTGHK